MAGTALTDYSDLINLSTSSTAEIINFYKSARVNGAASTAPVAGRWTSLWQYDGSPGGGSSSAPSSTAAVCTNATAGGLQQASPASGAKKRLVSFTLCSLAVGTFVLADRLVQQGGLSGTTTAGQTVSSPALTRFTSGIGVEAAMEIYTIIGTTATTGKLYSYTNTVPTAAQVGLTVVVGNTGFREAQRLIPLPVASGDKGITAVSTAGIAASTLTAGSWGVTLFKRLATLPLGTVGAGEQWNCMLKSGGPVDLGTNADSCLWGMFYPNTTTIPEIYGQFFFIEK